jgi:peroxiredoxin
MRTTSLAALLLSTGVALAAQPAPAHDAFESFTRAGQDLPSFSIKPLNGSAVATADWRGKVVLINFWATWCGPCREEMPRLEKEIWQKYKGSPDFVMLAIAREQNESEIAGFGKKNGFTFPLAADPERKVYKQFASAGIPRCYLIGRDGKILFQTLGLVPKEFDDMLRLIDQQLKRSQ